MGTSVTSFERGPSTGAFRITYSEWDTANAASRRRTRTVEADAWSELGRFVTFHRTVESHGLSQFVPVLAMRARDILEIRAVAPRRQRARAVA